ncbi:surfactant protein Ba [Halichoeres trimaculatus]|uniref:surfactant protein Ba n=1 Tax=Halichoeres trimaculatus TaxID=147232 RepID=UPI003D9F0F58
MASLRITLLLFVCLQGCALTSALNAGGGLYDAPVALTANGDVCKDCTQIIELLADLFSNPDLQKKIMDAIDSVCDHLPGPPGTAKLCKDEVQKFLPVAITFITTVVKPAEFCKSIGLCGSSDMKQIVHDVVKEALQTAATSDNVAQSKECTFCIFLIKELESLLPRQRTEEAVVKLVGEICHLLPSIYRDQCQTVVSKFTKAVLEAIMTYATPQAICALIHLCDGQEAPLVDPCTLAEHRCKDVRTALQCGTVFYCQKFAWKLSDSKTF